MPPIKYLRDYEDVTFPLPANFWDDYEGRQAAKEQQMNISSGHDMDLIYDNKVYLPGDSSRLSQTYLAYVNRLDEKSRQTYWQFYDSCARYLQLDHGFCL